MVSDDDSDDLFKTLANTQLWRTAKESSSYAGEVTKLYREVFTPTQPKQNAENLAGRSDTIVRITQAIEEEQAHVILLGHRRFGKSSILNAIGDAARKSGYLVAQVPCTADLSFATFLRAAFDDISVAAAETPAGHVLAKQIGVERLSDLIDPTAQDVQSALLAFSRIAPHRILILVDDFHRICNTAVKQSICDLVNALTANDAAVSLVIAARDDGTGGPGFDYDEEFSGAISVVLDPMRSEEIEELLRTGGQRVGIRFEENVLHSIIVLCQGSPAIAQWMGLLTARRVLRRYDDSVAIDDVLAAAKEAAVKADAHAHALIEKTLATRNDAADLENVLYLAARAAQGAGGVFTPEELNRQAARMGAPPYREHKLHRALYRVGSDTDAIIEKLTDSDSARYRFTDPLMRAIILLRNAPRERPVDTEVLEAYLRHQALPPPRSDLLLDDEFSRWLRFVLSPEERDVFRRWTDDAPAGHAELRKQFRRARDEHGLAILLHDIQAILANITGDDVYHPTEKTA